MAKVLFANNATTLLATYMSRTSTSLVVSSGTGALFPSIEHNSGDYFYVTIVDTEGNFEIVKVTSRTGDSFVIERAQDGTSAIEFEQGSIVEHRVTAGSLNDIVTTLVDEIRNVPSIIYPIGSIYMSLNSTEPSILFGGTWERLEEGRVLIGSNGNYPSGSVGGEFTHTLVEEEIPSHAHTGTTTASAGNHSHTRGTMNITGQFVSTDHVLYPSEAKGAFYANTASDLGDRDHQLHSGNPIRFYFDASRTWTGSTSTAGNHSHSVTVAASGGNREHNNMQPYLAVYMWKRLS